jgi:hypothetical protein
MGVHGGPDIVEDGLVFAVDAGNGQSYVSGSLDTFSLVSSETGSIHNDVTFDSSNGGSWVFDGADDIINFGNFLSLSTVVTAMAWVKVDTWVSYEGFITQINSAGSFLLVQDASGTPGSLYFAIYQSDTTWKQIIGTGVAPTSGWFHCAGVADGSYLRMYINGISVGTPVAYDGTIRTSTDDVCIGGRASNTYLLDGSVANALIYTRGLSASEVLQNYNATKQRFI